MRETTCTIITLLLCLHLSAQTDNRDIQLDLAEGDNSVLWQPEKRILTMNQHTIKFAILKIREVHTTLYYKTSSYY